MRAMNKGHEAGDLNHGRVGKTSVLSCICIPAQTDLH